LRRNRAERDARDARDARDENDARDAPDENDEHDARDAHDAKEPTTMNLLSGPQPSFAADIGFLTIVFALVIAAFYAVPLAARRVGDDPQSWEPARKRFVYGLLAWMAVTKLVAMTGVLTRFDDIPPPLMLLVGASLVLSTSFALSKLGGLLAVGLPLWALVGFQAFRLPLELVLHRLFDDGVLPAQMTYSGMNYDIVTGITAIVVAAWAAVAPLPRFVLLAWNLLGLALLLVIVTIAVLSFPGPLRAFPNDPANAIVASSPFVWLPTLVVQAGWIGHLLVFRRLRATR
jgi:hypothetical protein